VILGFDYLQLSTDRDPKSPNTKPIGADYVTLDVLKQKELVTDVTLTTDIKAKARNNNMAERAMVGYFHGNCGHCHNPRSSAGLESLPLRFVTKKNEAGKHDAITRTVGHKVEVWQPPANVDAKGLLRIKPNEPKKSAIFLRMLARDEDDGHQMPPLASKVQDAQALERLQEWIAALPNL
jgi:hypothetical protein